MSDNNKKNKFIESKTETLSDVLCSSKNLKSRHIKDLMNGERKKLMNLLILFMQSFVII